MRYLFVAFIILFDLIAFFAPIGSIFLGYVIIAKPIWFKEFIYGKSV